MAGFYCPIAKYFPMASQIVVVAGGTGGLGCAVSLAFLGRGDKVVVTFRSQPEYDELRGKAGPHLARLSGSSVDVTDETAVQQLIDGIVGEHSRLDALVNAVGGYAGGTLWDTTAALFNRMLALNLHSGFVLARAAARVMLKRHQGSIVNIAAKAAFDHPAGLAAYAASKAAAVAMIDSLAADLKGSGVRANSVLPSIIDTQANRQAMPNADFSKWPKPEDIARVILFLCSDEARLVHGAAVPVYGNS
jgi:NAD(P)-dependent dehydrogenase (short-subunit alcohol dehydrogenase family)